MQYDNKYDFDHNDCPEYENASPEEFASDFVVETDDEYDGDNFDTVPDEYGYDEQAATTDDQESDGVYDTYGSADEIAPHPYSGHNEGGVDINTEYSSETSSELTDNYDIESADDDSAYQYITDPADEQAATCDDWYHDTESARERCELDDYEIISDVLGSEKQIVKLYSTALCEAAEENFRDIIRENFTEAAADQYKAFTFMQERGMYEVEQATEQKISEAKQQFTPLCRNCK